MPVNIDKDTVQDVIQTAEVLERFTDSATFSTQFCNLTMPMSGFDNNSL